MSEILGPRPPRYFMNSTIAALPHLLEIMNGANGMSDIEGKVTRVGASERGQRTSFKCSSQSLITNIHFLFLNV